MTTTAAAQPVAEYRFRSPGDGVYRVALFERSGAQSGTAFFTGSGDLETLRLPPGEYIAIVTDVGQNLAGRPTPLSLSQAGGTVDLSILRPDAAAARRGSSVSSWSSLNTRTSAPVGRRAEPQPTVRPRAGERGPVLGRLGMSLTTLPDFDVDPAPPPPVARPPRLEAVAFDVALSEDVAPGSIGGWRAPLDLRTTARPVDGGGALIIGISDARLDQRDGGARRSRLRMSLAVEGRPAIRVPIPLFRRGVEVRIRPKKAGAASDLEVEVVAVEKRVQGLVAALGDLNAEEATSVLKWVAGREDQAIELLAGKMRDPWAAAVAAIVLTKFGRLDQVSGWVQNLARIAPNIADAHIAAAWATVGFGQGGLAELESEALDQLQRARRTGAPTFSVGNSLGLEMLNTLRSTALKPRVRKTASAEYARAKARSGFRLFRSPYMIWEQPGERLRGGRLQGARYLSVASGSVRGSELRIDRLAGS